MSPAQYLAGIGDKNHVQQHFGGLMGQGLIRQRRWLILFSGDPTRTITLRCSASNDRPPDTSSRKCSESMVVWREQEQSCDGRGSRIGTSNLLLRIELYTKFRGLLSRPESRETVPFSGATRRMRERRGHSCFNLLRRIVLPTVGAVRIIDAGQGRHCGALGQPCQN
jgi:hypothetical protein